MQAIKQLQKQGYGVSLIGEDIRCQKLEGANPDPAKVNQLLKEIKANKAEAVRYLKKPFSYDQYLRDAITQLNEAGVGLTDASEEDRRRSLNLEIEFAGAANRNDDETFRRLVDRWRDLFLRYTRTHRETDLILCPYKGVVRRVHPEVCKWHREMNDPECKRCDPSKRRLLH